MFYSLEFQDGALSLDEFSRIWGVMDDSLISSNGEEDSRNSAMLYELKQVVEKKHLIQLVILQPYNVN